MTDEAEQFARRDHLARELAKRMTPEERVARARQLEEWSLEQLQSNPEAFERFMRRNLRKRAVGKQPDA